MDESPLHGDDDQLGSGLFDEKDDEQKRKEQKERLKRAAERGRNPQTSQGVLPRMKTENKQLHDDLEQKKIEMKELEQQLTDSSTAKRDLQAKLDDRDIKHREHLNMKLTEKENVLKEEFETRKATLQDTLSQTRADLLKKQEEKEKEYRVDLDLKETAYQKAVDKFVKKEGEIQKMRAELTEKETDWETKSLDHKKEVERWKFKLEEAEKLKQKELADNQAKHASAVQNLEFLLEQAQTQHKEGKQKQEEELTQETETLELERNSLQQELNDQLFHLQQEVRRWQEQYHQLEIHFQATRELDDSILPSDGDVSIAKI